MFLTIVVNSKIQQILLNHKLLVSQVAELYELMKKWDAVADSLPHIVDRLTALKDLHEQGQWWSAVMGQIRVGNTVKLWSAVAQW